MNKDKAMQQALELIERLNMRGWILADFEDEVYATLNSLKAALEQPPLPVQEPTPWRDMVVVSLVREGVNKHKARELADHFATQPLPVQEPVACRFCFSEKGCWTWQCYHCGEIDDVQQPAPPLTVQPEPLEYWNAVEGWGMVKVNLDNVKIDEVREHFNTVNCGMIYKHGGEGRVPLYTAPPQRQWDKPSDNFNAWWDSDRRRDNANPFTTDSFAYWAWEGWQAAQRPWVGLTKQDMPSGEDPMFDHQYFIAGMVYAAKVLQEKNT